MGILYDAHWRHEKIKVAAHPRVSPKGVTIEIPNLSAPPAEAMALAAGLTAAGIPFDQSNWGELDPNGSGKWVAGLIISQPATGYNSTGR
jgi:hypothetical protein